MNDAELKLQEALEKILGTKSVFEANPDLTINSLTVLVNRLGGRVKITQAELDLLVAKGTVMSLDVAEDEMSIEISVREDGNAQA